MIKIAICDDKEVIIGQIEEILLKASKTYGIQIDIDSFYSGESLEKEILSGTQYDLIFLDIQMEQEDGMSAANNIRDMDENFVLVFVSGYDKYCIELFQFDVFAFVKKPIKKEEFVQIFLKANSKICKKKIYFSYQYQNKELKIPCSEILYFESIGRQIQIHQKTGKVAIFNGKLNNVESSLMKGKIPFLRIHQSYFVNYHYIKAISKTTVTLSNDLILSISTEKRKNLNKEYGKLLGGEISD